MPRNWHDDQLAVASVRLIHGIGEVAAVSILAGDQQDRAEYLERHGLPKHVTYLQRHRLIGYRFITLNRILPLILNNSGEELTVEMPVSITTSDIDVMADAVRAGLGIGRLLEPVHQGLADRDEFIPVLEPHGYPALFLYFPQNSQRAKRIRAAIDFLAEG